MKWEQITSDENFEISILVQTKSIEAHSKLTHRDSTREIISDGLDAISKNVKEYFNAVLESES